MITLKKTLKKIARVILCVLGILFTLVFFVSIYLDYYFMKITNRPPVLGFGASVIMAVICFLLPGIIFLVVSYNMKSKDTNHIDREDSN